MLHNNVQVVGDRSSVKEYLRLLSSVLALVSGNDAAELAKVKPFAVEAVQVSQTLSSMPNTYGMRYTFVNSTAAVTMRLPATVLTGWPRYGFPP